MAPSQDTLNWHWPELPGLVNKWLEQAPFGLVHDHIARRAADWQLEQVCALLVATGWPGSVELLRKTMRPAPPVSADEALAVVDSIDQQPVSVISFEQCQILRAALLRLQQLEQEADQ